MKLLTKALQKKLLAAAAGNPQGKKDLIPLVKFFNPCGAQTWLISEMQVDGTMFGLCDLGHGCPELGYVSLFELEAIRLPFGLKIERDLHWEGGAPLSEYATFAQQQGYIGAGGLPRPAAIA
jgi:hypothetical protein